MSWSYKRTEPAAIDLDWVRLRVGDTDESDQLLQDEEIQALIDNEGSRSLAAVLCAETIAAKFARRVDKTVGKLSISAGQMAEHYMKLATRLRMEVAIGSAGVYAGGISVADKADNDADTDVVRPAFAVGQFDWAGPSSS